MQDKQYDDLIVPGYKLQKKIAQGGMASIFRATRLEDGLVVVLKVLFTKEHQDPNSLKRFIQEYKLIATIKNKHVVHIYERGFASEFSYIAMEYLPSANLAKRVRKNLSSETSISYLQQIAQGLVAIHERNIVHRDMKPSNILFQDDDILKITDFGAAKIMGHVIQDLTVQGFIIGTPYYMSPEQCSGAAIDTRSDIYSLGIIFYIMLTGRHPFRSKKGTDALIKAHIEGPIPKLPDTFNKYQSLIDGMMAKDPGDRFQSASELLSGIDWTENGRKQ